MHTLQQSANLSLPHAVPNSELQVRLLEGGAVSVQLNDTHLGYGTVSQ